MTTRRPLSDDELLQGLGAAFSHMGSRLEVPEALSPEQMMKRVEPLPLRRPKPWIARAVPAAAVFLLAIFAVYFLRILDTGNLTAGSGAAAEPESSLSIAAKGAAGSSAAAAAAYAADSAEAATAEEGAMPGDSLPTVGSAAPTAPSESAGGTAQAEPYPAENLEDIYLNLQIAASNVQAFSAPSPSDAPPSNDGGTDGTGEPAGSSDDAGTAVPDAANGLEEAVPESEEAIIDRSGSWEEETPPPLIQSKLASTAMVALSDAVTANGVHYQVEEDAIWMSPASDDASAVPRELDIAASGLLAVEDRLVALHSENRHTTLDILQTYADGETEPTALHTYTFDGTAVAAALCDGRLILLLEYAVDGDLLEDAAPAADPDSLLPTLQVEDETYALQPESVTILPDSLLPGYLVCAVIDPMADDLRSLSAEAVLGGAGPVLLTGDSLYVTHLAADGESTWLLRFTLGDTVAYDSYCVLPGRLLDADWLGMLDNGLIAAVTDHEIGLYDTSLLPVNTVDLSGTTFASVEIEGNTVQLLDGDGNAASFGFDDPEAPTIACGYARID